MSVIDLEKLLAPLSDEAPSGDDLEYDAGYLELERLSRGKPEQQMGDDRIPAEPPDWKEVRRLALELLNRTRDLRIGVLLTQSLIATDGWRGFADGLGLIQGYVERFWDSVHPALDPTDPDPILRTNALSALAVFEPTLRMLREAPIVSSRGLGAVTYRDVLIASNKIEAPADSEREPVSMGVIHATFDGAGLEDLQSVVATLDECLAAAAAIEGGMTARVGAALSVDLAELSALLKGTRQVVREALSRRTGEGGEAGFEEEAPGSDAGAAPAGGRAVGEIRSREDVIRALDKVSRWFEQNEPSSPVPLLLNRAKRLTSKSFLEIVKDLAPDGLSQVEMIRGREEE